MTSQTVFRRFSPLAFLPLCFCFAANPAAADTSHARIIRLSYVQGDVRIAHNVSGDPLQSAEGAWERASLNLPIHQGDALATDNGRAAVEFESGTSVFLAENTVLEFYDLSLDDGSFTTRLILRQGSASFSVKPSRGDYFSVTGGDFSVEANEKSYFRVNNYDDGSDVQVFRGHLSVLSKGKTTPLWKGQSLSMRAADPDSVSVDSASNTDEFDQWVSGKIESGEAALNGSRQYSGVYDYTSGFGDLYTFGGWYPVDGFGYCWRPYGVSFGWNPFQMGRWYFDPSLGNWVFVGGQPWGWLPYHYGSWLFHPGLGWVWTPTGAFPYARGGSFAYARNGGWRPVTATWVRSGSSVGLVPTHPLDTKGKTPINMREGVFPVSERGVLDRVQVSRGENWKTFKNTSREALPTESASAAPPARVVRSMAAGPSSTGFAAASRGSGIAYDPAEHRFVNSAAPSSTERVATEGRSGGAPSEGQVLPGNVTPRTSDLRRGVETLNGRGEASLTPRASAPPSRSRAMPPTPPPASSSARGGGSGSVWNGSGGSSRSSSGASSGGSSRTWSGGSSSSSSSSSSRSSGSSSSGSSGGRPH
jgi:hypothetical protein